MVPQGGYFLWVELPEGTDVAAIADLAKEKGVVFVKGTDFLLEGGENALPDRLLGRARGPDRRGRRAAGVGLPRALRRGRVGLAATGVREP